MTENLEVAAFTDTYLPTVNGVTYTVSEWADRWNEELGQMNIVYPDSNHSPNSHEFPVPSAPFPFYPGYRAAVPWIPEEVRNADIVHSHSMFSVGIAGWVLAQALDVPFVVSYHTPMQEYADYVVPTEIGASLFGSGVSYYEAKTIEAADLVLAPSPETKRELSSRIDGSIPIRVLSNGVNLDHFAEVDTSDFKQRYDLSGTLIGYTGRHGYEKRLEDLIKAAERLEESVTVVFGGDGPAREELSRVGDQADVDVRFLGLLERDELPEFYSALDIFGFPSPVETEGIVGMEAIACGTPVVGADAGALQSTIQDGVTGYRYEARSIPAMTNALEDALEDHDTLRDGCLEFRNQFSVSSTIQRLRSHYIDLL
ncbi:glycosyltransferase [Halorubellus salinus]|uniref:glycosyltransferase n=1 Tax=Halorubellus salinus TaxID=755309 RepID=UPI001D0915D3|nr:glycosyltransferase [Halorubellus salinus]